MRSPLPTTSLVASLLVLAALADPLSGQREVLEVEGLAAPVEILRDRWGIAHIYAENQRDLFFAQGFNVARDRLFQLEMWRRQATGTLAEILGPRAVAHDVGARLLRARVDMDAELRHYHPDGEEIVTSFVRGINAWIDWVREHPELLPIELEALGVEPGHWTPEVVVSRHNGLYRNVRAEVELARAVRAHGVEEVLRREDFEPEPVGLAVADGLDLEAINAEVIARYEAARAPVRFRREDLRPEYRAAGAEPREEHDPDDRGARSGRGSNNWVVAGDRTFSKRPIMANDPHRRQQIPSLRYWVHLHAPGWNVIGGGEPALPGVSIGHNEHGAWGLTIFAIDQEDLYVYETDATGERYRYGDGWEPMHVERETIAVEGGEPVEATLKFTRHGPVLHEDRERRLAFALRAAWLEVGSAPYLASLRMDQARSWEEFREACTYSHTPSENMVWAGADGHIGWQAAGITPIREAWHGLLPVPGDGRYEWRGFLPIRELPHELDPPRGFIATANENNLPSGYPHRLGYSWSDPSRSRRLHEVLGAPRKHTLVDMLALQQDELSLPARMLIALLDGLAARTESGAAALRALRAWDHVMTADSVAATIFAEWRERLRTRLAPIHAPGEHPQRPSLQQAIGLLVAPDGRFGADPLASRDRLLVDCLEAAVAELTERLGADTTAWRYGQPGVHWFELRHPLSGLLARERAAELDLGPIPRGGSEFTVTATGSGRQRYGASFRIIANTADWDASLGTNNPGQSGVPADPHYADLFAPWAAGRYFPVLFTRSKVEAATERTTVLEPGR